MSLKKVGARIQHSSGWISFLVFTQGLCVHDVSCLHKHFCNFTVNAIKMYQGELFHNYVYYAWNGKIMFFGSYELTEQLFNLVTT